MIIKGVSFSSPGVIATEIFRTDAIDPTKEPVSERTELTDEMAIKACHES